MKGKRRSKEHEMKKRFERRSELWVVSWVFWWERMMCVFIKFLNAQDIKSLFHVHDCEHLRSNTHFKKLILLYQYRKIFSRVEIILTLVWRHLFTLLFITIIDLYISLHFLLHYFLIIEKLWDSNSILKLFTHFFWLYM